MSRDNPTGMGTFVAPAPQITWLKLLDAWDEIKADIAETFRVDLDLPEQSRGVCWHWVSARITALLTAPSQSYRPDGYPMPPNRTRARLFPLPAPKSS